MWGKKGEKEKRSQKHHLPRGATKLQRKRSQEKGISRPHRARLRHLAENCEEGEYLGHRDGQVH